MGRIVFINPHPKGLISGGVKTVYRQVELLNELGLEAYVFQADGQADWLESSARVLTTPQPAPSSDEILVFPETPQGWLADMAQTPMAAQKVLFCQAQYYTYHSTIPVERLPAIGYSRIACVSEIAKGFLERVLHLKDVAVIPCFIDENVFFPRRKAMQIAFLPHKLPRELAIIHRIFTSKYPHLRSIPWHAIEQKSEAATAELLGQSTIYLSLPFLESLGLVPLEAMSSGCIVVGFHGYGGLEYASSENGFWFAPDYLEEVADALARVVTGIERDESSLAAMREAGLATARQFNRERTRGALSSFYGSMVR